MNETIVSAINETAIKGSALVQTIDPNWLYSSIAQSSAAIVGLMGAFLTTKLINQRSIIKNNENQIRENKAKIEFLKESIKDKEEWVKKAKSKIFLIHDSIIFDGVDERQKARALQLAKSESEKEGFQYICTMNSDAIPRNDFDKDFDFDKYVVKTFTDEKEEGSLLGIRF